ncbi:sodium-coupled neutral amino acid transporter 3-like isoform X1 [Takifugu rubripes]|uniref:Solute carrier family 38 member 3a n=1 Tax=Takifugu rubripes TaxID=31033 RepID=A0A674N2P4_TAKRU|nr:sodium-coupled neutral amino acid transporter 3-like isoform X1 [Takifugu rubripes]XP_029682923.1 sodium-coupled neutral amino acid transporter 3-like isoform X1 [Takifugu rubripes]XP_056886377.1 sodium-coupled neutral amino acid transporter 3-like isoform X1 [Takifugu flavidus]XP_056886378.1 sodium-coupled neutral amino acid transporter 3-like isoform X1 [Takifugu flavidus]
MSEDKAADTVETAPDEANAIPNGKGHEAGEEITALPNTPPAGEGEKDNIPNSTQNESPNRTENADGQEFLSGTDDKKTTRFTDFEGKTSFGMSVFNLGNAIMGSGILGLAYAMANTGVVLFLILLTVVAVLSSYSIHLLLKSSGVVGIRAYEQLGYRAFGTPGKMAAGIAITLQNIGAMSSYLYIVKYEFPLVIQAFLKVDNPAGEWFLNGNYLVVIVSIAVILPLALMKQLGYLGYTSGFSLSCMVFFLISVIYKKFTVPCPFVDFALNATAIGQNLNGTYPSGEADAACIPKMANLNTRTAYTIPILAFAFVCHPEVLPIYTELRNPTKKKMQHVSNISIAVMYVMYFLAALFGYLTFYGKVEAELLHTYSRIDPYDTLILCVRVAVLTAVTLTVPIVLFPVRRAIQQMVFPNKTFYWPRHIAIAFVLLTFINLLVIFAPNILGIFGIIGATSAPCLIFIFPAVFYIRIVPKEEEPSFSVPKILAACFAGIGFLFMIMSLSFIIIDWTTGSSNASSGH